MNDKSFEQVFREHFKPLTNLAYTVVKDKEVAKDVVQQVFLRLWQNRNETVIRGSMKSYLYRAVVNTSLNHISAGKKFISIEVQNIEYIPDEYEGMHGEDSKSNVERHVSSAVNELSPVCQEVFRLSRFSDLTNKEIAHELNISVKSVEKHVTKALKILRDKLKPLMKSEVAVLLWVLLKISFFEVGFFYLTLSF